MMRGISDCCKDCEKRHPGCHDHCDEYLDAKTKYLEGQLAIKNAKNDPFFIYKVERIRKAKGKK